MNKGGECVKGMAFEASWSFNNGEDLCWKESMISDPCVVWGVSKLIVEHVIMMTTMMMVVVEVLVV